MAADSEEELSEVADGPARAWFRARARWRADGLPARGVLGMLSEGIAYGAAIRAAKREQDDRPSQNRHV